MRRRAQRGLPWAAGAALWFVTAPTARAAVPERYVVDAVVDPERGTVVARVRASVRPEPGERSLRFWSQAAKVTVAPDELDEQSWRWVYPGEVDLGRFRVVRAALDGVAVEARVHASDRAHAGVVVELPRPAGARAGAAEGAPLEVELEVSLALPRRFGRFGRHGDTLYLLGPWYPVALAADGGHRADVPHHVRLEGPPSHAALVGDASVAPLPLARTAYGAYAPVVVSRALGVRTRRVDGATLRVVSAEGFYDPPPPDAVGLDALDDVVAIDRVGLLAEALDGLGETLRSVGVAPPSRLDVLVFPSRTELAATAPGLVLVSDRSFELAPLPNVRAFHVRRVREAMLRHVVEAAVDRVEAPADRTWAADLRARVLADLDEARRRDRAKSPRELLAAVAFHPVVDNLLYARQVPFLDVYFEHGTAPSPLREDPDQARRPRPKARRLLDASRLVLDRDAYAAFVEGLARGGTPARALLARASPDAAAELDGWLTPCAVNLRLGEVTSARVPEGHRHTVTLHRDGRRTCDVVEVAARDVEGNEARAVWREEGAVGRVTLVTPARLDRVVIDPAGHVVQDPDLADGHPRADDATSWPFRPPILEGFNLSLSFADAEWLGFVTFGLKRLYDLDSTWLVTLFRDPGRAGGIVRYVRGVGPKRHGNARVAAASVGVDLARLDASFAEAEEGGWRFGLVGTFGLDTRVFRIDPREGVIASLNGRAGGVRRDSGELVWTGAVSGTVGGMVPLALRHALLLVASAGWTFGDALSSEKQRVGGIAALRGFEVAEVVGDGALDAVVEYRFTAVTDLAMNLLHLAWLRELQLVAFAGAGLLVGPEGADAEVWGLADVGVGLRLHVDYAGVQPGLVSLDLAWPLTSTPSRQGLVAGGAPSPAFYLYFTQYL